MFTGQKALVKAPAKAAPKITPKELFQRLAHIPADPNNEFAVSLARQMAEAFKSNTLATNAIFIEYSNYIGDVRNRLEAKISHREKLKVLSAALNVGCFIQLHLIKDNDIRVQDHRLIIVDLWATITNLKSCAEEEFQISPAGGLNWLLLVSPVLDACYLELRQLIEDIASKKDMNIQLPLLNHMVTNVLPETIIGYSTVLATFYEMYVKIGDLNEASKYKEKLKVHLNIIEKNWRALASIVPVSSLNEILIRSNFEIDRLDKTTDTVRQSKEIIEEYKDLIREKAAQLKKAQPAYPFDLDNAGQVSSSSSFSDNLAEQFDRIKADITPYLAEPLLYTRVINLNSDANTKFKETFRALGQLTQSEYHKNAEKNLNSAIELCTQWVRLFTENYTDDAAPIVKQFNKILSVLNKHLQAASSRIPNYFEPLLLEIAQIEATAEVPSPALQMPNPVPLYFQNRFQKYVVNHPRFTVSEEINFESLDAAEQHLVKLQENVNILEYALTNLDSRQKNTPYSDQLTHFLCQTLASINHTTARLIKENMIPQALVTSYLNRASKNYVLMANYAHNYQKLLQYVDRTDVLVTPFVQDIKPKWLDALYSVMTGYIDYASLQWHQSDRNQAARALLLAYDNLKFLMYRASLSLPEAQYIKTSNEMKELTLSIYLSAFDCREFQNFIRQASGEVPAAEQIPLAVLSDDFWTAYGQYLNQASLADIEPSNNHLLTNVILESRINALRYVLSQLDESSPWYPKTLGALWESSYQRYVNASVLSSIVVIASEEQKLREKADYEHYKNQLDSLIPSITKLENKAYNAQISSFKGSEKKAVENTAVKKTGAFSPDELDAMARTSKNGRRKATQAQTVKAKDRPASKKQPQSTEEQEVKYILPRSAAATSTSFEEPRPYEPWIFKSKKTPGTKPKAVPDGARPQAAATAASSNTKPKSHAASSNTRPKAAPHATSSTKAASSSVKEKPAAQPAWTDAKTTIEKILGRTTFDTYQGIQSDTIFEDRAGQSVEPKEGRKLKTVSENSTVLSTSAEVVAQPKLPLKRKLDSSDCPVVDGIDPRIFRLPREIWEICLRLHKAGYQSYISGGLIRDRLLGLRPHDVDIVTDCPRDVAYKLFNGWGKLSKRHPDLYFLCPGVDLVSSTSSTLKEEAEKKDAECNALFFCPIKRKLYDPLNCYKSIYSRTLTLIGNAYTRLVEDPSRILRIIRFAHSLNKNIGSHTQDLIQIIAPSMVKLPFSVRVNNIKAMFFRDFGLAMKNYQYLIDNKIMSYLFSSDENEKSYYPEDSSISKTFNRYWQHALSEIYRGRPPIFANSSDSDEIISLMLFIRLKGYQVKNNTDFTSALADTIKFAENFFEGSYQSSLFEAMNFHQRNYDSFEQPLSLEEPVMLLPNHEPQVVVPEQQAVRLQAEPSSSSSGKASSSVPLAIPVMFVQNSEGKEVSSEPEDRPSCSSGASSSVAP
ncbi:Poly(A) polymerase I precursor [Legionella massiliensis]|uniref:Poly(A) polymerase I n=1 Tax=Legionella massiliensis TaxID=1034943 RepID=A0A078KWZ9_9GAMM|nr:CCA tRNA nucleotidyltransferase [Legionella massiliensis]CDZ78930.1 Poly(A) polymerase I precursor [Legionella massiliensis]CEE14668.1 Poly(A) polymerase I precursor [Legionella massiliensis]